MFLYFPIVFLAMSLFFLFIGMKVILSNRPLFIPSGYFFGFMVLAFSPQLINTAMMMTRDLSSSIGLMIALNTIMLLLVLWFIWIQMKGYMAIGVSDDSFRDALHYSLGHNGIPFEEQLSVIKLHSVNAELQVAIQSWVGAGQLKIKKSKDQHILPAIIGGMNEYYRNNQIGPNKITPIFYITFGILMAIFAVVFFFLLS